MNFFYSTIGENEVKMKLSKQSLECVVKLFQKGLLLESSVKHLLEDLRFDFEESMVLTVDNEEHLELNVTNPELCELTSEEIKLATAWLQKEVEA